MTYRDLRGVVLKVGTQYVYWHPHHAEWKLGPRRLSEIFPFSPFRLSNTLQDVLILFPSAVFTYES